MKTLIVVSILFASQFANAGTVCNIRDMKNKVAVGSDQQHGDYVYTDGRGYEALASKTDETYQGDRGTVVNLDAKTVKINGVKLHLENCHQTN